MPSADFDARAFWHAVLAQDAAAMRGYFHPDAQVRWHCTNERFTAEEFIRANCEYPGNWHGEIERMQTLPGQVITVTRVWPTDASASFHAVSFIQVTDGLIAAMDEYWADDGEPPAWRKQLRLGTPLI